MTSMLYEIKKTVEMTAVRSSFPFSRILNILGISRTWYNKLIISTNSS